MVWDRCAVVSQRAQFVLNLLCRNSAQFTFISLDFLSALHFLATLFAGLLRGRKEWRRFCALPLVCAFWAVVVVSCLLRLTLCTTALPLPIEGSNTVELLLCRRPQLQAHAPSAAANQLLHFSLQIPASHIFTSSSHLRGRSLKSRIESSSIYTTLHFIL
jgi:hypothetical protein